MTEGFLSERSESKGTQVAVHFGAGNIGRGFVGLLLSQAGYRVVFADVQTALVDAIAAAGEYTVHEVGDGAVEHHVTGVTALDSNRDLDALVATIASAEIVTTAVGPNILKFVAPTIAAGLAARAADAPPLLVMACENALGGTDLLRTAVEGVDPDAALKARWANTAVDRIVPGQPDGAGIDVTVEHYFEWVIDDSGLDAAPSIPGATVVPDLGPYIERKLFTVNTGHATTAYHGALAGHETIAAALADPAVEAEVRAVLEETSAMLVAKHGIDPVAQQAYREKIITRFANPALPDTVWRVGREPLRKLSRHERFISPAAELAEGGTEPVALLRAMGAALRFRSDDPQSAELAELLATLSVADAVLRVTGIGAAHPLFAGLAETFAAARQA